MNEEAKVLALNQKLLDSIAKKDYNTYALLCADDMTCFEKGTLVEGLSIHKTWFDIPKSGSNNPVNHMCQPKVRMLGPEAAVVAYIRLQQITDGESLQTLKSQETRVWQMINGAWKNVHFHRKILD